MSPNRAIVSLLGGLALILLNTLVFAEQLPSQLLHHRVSEPGIAPYPSRTLITKDFVRIDDGHPESDFVLYDRHKRVVYNVVHDDETILEIDYRAMPAVQPGSYQSRSRQLVIDKDAPRISGQLAQHHRLEVNGKECLNVVAVAGLLDDAVAALGEFHLVLAGESGWLLPNLPQDQRNWCEMATSYYESQWVFKFGLPLRVWGADGTVEELVDFKERVMVDESLFYLPVGFTTYSP